MKKDKGKGSQDSKREGKKEKTKQTCAEKPVCRVEQYVCQSRCLLPRSLVEALLL